MKQFESKLLNMLIDKYESSIVSKGGSERNIQIIIKSNDKIFSKYWSDDSYLYRDDIEAILRKHSESRVISIKRDRFNEIKSVILNLDYVNDLYEYLKRDNPKLLNKQIKQMLSDYTNAHEPLNSFSKEMIRRIDNYESVKSYIDNISTLELVIKAILAMQNLEEDTLKRNFSKVVFNDSKTFERIEGKICRIYIDFGDYSDYENDEILEQNHIIKNPTYVYIKGDISIQVNMQIIHLKDFGYEIALSKESVDNITIINCKTNKVITIENLTTFVTFNDKSFISIYIAGFSNTIQRNLLSKLFNYDSKLKFYHFGDIDAGGFLILADLIKKTNIMFKPYLMDIDTLKKYKDNWTLLTDNDIKRLKNLLGQGYDEVINFMIKHKCKLEQEIVLL